MSSNFSKPPANPPGGGYTADQVKLRRDQQPGSIYDGAFSQAWEMVKQNPLETLLLSFVFLMFNGGGNGCSGTDFSGLGDDGNSGGETGWESGSQYGGDLLSAAGDIVGNISGMEMALIGGIIMMTLVVTVIMLVIGTLVRAGANIYWLRLVRGQSATLGHTVAATRFFLPLLVASLVSGIAMVFGFMLLIIPGIILALGFYFITQIAVDKNLGYIEGVKASWNLVDGYKMELFIFAILCFLLNIAGFLMCCVGMIATNAVVMGATVIVYDRIAEPGNAYLEDGEMAGGMPMGPPPGGGMPGGGPSGGGMPGGQAW